MTLPVAWFRRVGVPARRHPLVWQARLGGLDALTGQVGALTRATSAAALDTGGASYTANYGQPRWHADAGLATLRMGGGVTEYLRWTMDIKPQAMSVMVDFIENGTIGIANGVIWSLTAAAGGSPLILVSENAGKYALVHNNGSTVVTSTMTGTAPTTGQRVRLRAIAFANGSVQLHQSIAGAAETSASVTAANTFAAAWAGSPPLLQLNANGTGNIGNSYFLGIALMRGNQSQAAMLAALAG